MFFWLTVLALTVAAVVIGFRPLLSARGAAGPGRSQDHEHDIAVYRHQLEELKAEQARGAISPSQAQQARNEVARRILAVEDRMLAARPAEAGTAPAPRSGRAVPALFALVFVPGLSLVVYTGIGSPGYEAQPLAMRIEAALQERAVQEQAQVQLRDLVARAEVHLRDNPGDGSGWDVLAPVYFRLGEVGKAQTAYRNAIRLLGETPQRLSGFGEVMVTAAGGIVTEEAASAFDRALAADPADARARFFDGLGAVQIGDYGNARRAWTDLATDAGADPAWRAVADQSLAQLAETAPPAQAAGRPPALDADTLTQAGELDAGARGAMVQDMVASLDARLRDDPDDLEGWKRLIRARIVLDQPDAVRDALERAHAVYGDRPEALEELRVFASGLGLDLRDHWR